MDCKAVKRSFVDYYYGHLDGEITPSLSDSLEAHLKVCHACKTEWEEIKITLDSIDRGEEIALPSWFWREYDRKVYERIERKRGWSFYHRLIPGIVATALLIIVIFGSLHIKRMSDEKAVVQDYVILENLDLLQDLEVIQHLEELEGIDLEGV